LEALGRGGGGGGGRFGDADALGEVGNPRGW